MVNELPSNVGYGTVRARFLIGYADGPDVDYVPDGGAASGSVIFTPSTSYLKNATASPDPVTILVSPIEALLDSQGYLTGPDGNPGIRIIATDDPDNNPVDWTWTVTYRLTDADGVAINALPSHSISVPTGADIDLLAVSPVPGSGGTFYISGPAGADGADGLSAYQIAVNNGFVGTEAAWLASLEGADGSPGATGATGPAGPGLPIGGTTGQIIKKASSTDYDTSWQDFTYAYSNLTGIPSTFTPSAHTHPQADITNLTTDLAGKAASVHTHAQSDITNLTTDLAAKAPLASPALTGAATVTGSSAASTPLVVKGSGSQSADFFKVVDSSDAALLTIASSGHLTVNQGSIIPVTGSTTEAPIDFQPGSLLTTPLQGAMEFDGSNWYVTSGTAQGRAVVDQTYYYKLGSNRAFSTTASTTTFVSLFNVGFTVEANRAYEVELVYVVAKGATSSTTFFNWLSGPTISSQTLYATSSAQATASTPATASHEVTFAAGSLQTTAASTAANLVVRVQGIVYIGATGGSLNPALSSSAALSCTTQAGSYMKIRPLGPSSSTSFGVWA